MASVLTVIGPGEWFLTITATGVVRMWVTDDNGNVREDPPNG